MTGRLGQVLRANHIGWLAGIRGAHLEVPYAPVCALTAAFHRDLHQQDVPGRQDGTIRHTLAANVRL